MYYSNCGEKVIQLSKWKEEGKHFSGSMSRIPSARHAFLYIDHILEHHVQGEIGSGLLLLPPPPNIMLPA